MNRTIHIFATLIACTAILAVGCSDANASESTYLPVDGSCITAASFTDEATDLHGLHEMDLAGDDSFEFDYDTILDEAYPSADSPFHFGEDGDEQWPSFDDPESLMRSPYLGQGPELIPVSTAGSEGPLAERTSGEAEGININSADADTLTELPGIGPALAERIVDYRRDRRFEDPSQLTRVRGIGSATYEEIAPYVRVE